jgi:hypothetical protein
MSSRADADSLTRFGMHNEHNSDFAGKEFTYTGPRLSIALSRLTLSGRWYAHRIELVYKDNKGGLSEQVSNLMSRNTDTAKQY